MVYYIVHCFCGIKIFYMLYYWSMDILTKQQIEDLIAVAKTTRENAFSHRSIHKIWASVLTANGEIFWWCNIESVISGLGTCAERCAIDHAVAHWHYNIVAICTIDSSYTPTCGACLQYALLFSQVSDNDILMITADTNGNYDIKPLTYFLPEWYRTQNNLTQIRSYNKGK